MIILKGCVPQIPLALATPSLNRGVAFSREERRRLGLTGRLPSGVLTLEQQASRVWQQLPADVIAFGKALVATGTPVAPIEYNGTSHTIGQANNVLVFPGIGLGVIVAGAWRVTKGMLDAAAKALARGADPTTVGAALLPDVKNLRALSAVVAEAVYHAAVEDGVATKNPDNVARAVVDTMWLPEYD